MYTCVYIYIYTYIHTIIYIYIYIHIQYTYIYMYMYMYASGEAPDAAVFPCFVGWPNSDLNNLHFNEFEKNSETKKFP